MKPARAVVWGGLAAGILDLAYALIEGAWRGGAPMRILQAIASGLLGRAAFETGWRSALLGVALHFTIAFGAAAVFFAASRKLRFLLERPVLWGALYGLAVYFFLQLVVLPLSAIPWQVRLTPRGLASGFAAHVFCVGLPIAFAVRRFGAAPTVRAAASL
jgi:hypothetical protein